MKLIVLLVFLSTCLQEVHSSHSSKSNKPKCKDARCPTDWKGYYGHCYLFTTSTNNFPAAKADCNSYGAYLVRIESENENNWLYNQIKTLGAPSTDFMTGGLNLFRNKWLWEDSAESFKYYAWPSSPTAANKVLVIHSNGNGQTPEWRTGDYANGFRYICEAEDETLSEYVRRNPSD